jgi:type I restriction enzyme S subunit
MTALLTDHLPLLAGATNGIKKLRELILELAVRGKLVPQDPLDESASSLLKRIAEEKARLMSVGEIKKSKATNEDFGEISHEIPSSWAVASLGQVVEIVRGITFPASEKSKEPELGRVACLRTANVQSEIEWDDLLYIRENFVSRDDQYVKPHDIVMSMANSRELVGKVALIGAELKQKTTFGGFLGVLRPVLIEPRFIMALLRTPHARSALIDSASQTTNIANVSLGKLRPLPFAIPPLAEQHRIVAKVDELMALCDRLEAQQADAESAHAQLVQALLDSLTQAVDAKDFSVSWHRLAEHFHTLFTTESSIDALKQALLQLAVMGKLVPQDPSDEPANEFLKRVAEEKARLVKRGILRKQKSLSDVHETEQPHALPLSWQWVRFDSISNSRLGKMLDKAKNKGELRPYLRNTNVQWFNFEIDDLKSMRFEEHELDEYRVNPGDLVICEGGEPGRCAVWQGEVEEMFIQKALHRARPLLGTSPFFLQFCLRADADSGFLDQFFTGATIKHFSGEKLAKYLVPLPPLAEQHRIVAKVDQLMALCNQLKARLSRARDVHEQLANSLISDAQITQEEMPEVNVIDLSAYLVSKLASQRTFGRVAHMKLLFFADAHLGLNLMEGYRRHAAGPLDTAIYQLEAQAQRDGVYSVAMEKLKSGQDKVTYHVGAEIAHSVDAAVAGLGSARTELDRIIALLGGRRTDDLEVVATLYAVWNDALLEGRHPDDDWLVNEFRTNWNKKKERFSPQELHKWLGWMRDHRLVPAGKGAATKRQAELPLS